ncbi:hypothetical protein Q5H92_24555 [Hymenobacter sp. M29]|uniref:T9SS type A sorting domain-containing protein n=1 Tax=Hymenobacter mellowenesis TaxID=3063995 RepID=A0ABT9AJJ9_9BACT|nr:hypothetical protein [Hymenobacter sp. M29]MDO7849557.1 hypothetical protein [Hymenobacter sp. M29]
MKKPLRYLLLLLLALGLTCPAHATAPPAAGHSLSLALNPDGTLRAGVKGSFDAHNFRMSTAPDGRPVFRPAGTTGTGDERWADGFGLPNGVDGSVNVVLQAGTDMYIGGSFSFVATSNAGGVAANFVAKWNGTTWTSLGTGPGNGVDNTVSALALAGNGDLYVGGLISRAGGVAVNGVAKWNGTTWSPLGTGLTDSGGLPGVGQALVVAGNGDLYAGGRFAQAGGGPASNIARWNGTAWSPLGLGAGVTNRNEQVNALALAANGDVYAGGTFSQAGGVAANNIAKWNGTAWSGLGAGVNGAVSTLAVAGSGDVYVGGSFTQAGGGAASNVARWNGTAWSPLGTGLDAPVRVLLVAGNGDVYAGGNFTQAGGVAANYVARWNGTAWSRLGTGAGLNNAVSALVLASNGDVYAGGFFIKADGIPASAMAVWNGTAWSSLGLGTGNGVYGGVYAVAVAGNGDVYVGGSFTQVGSVAANNIAKWNGTAWSPLGTGTAYGSSLGNILALALASNGDLYVGGNITQAGGVAAYFVAKWNGTAWSPLGAGMAPLNTAGAVLALAVAGNGDVYAGGRFTQAGGVTANRVAKWNGSVWSALGTGFADRNDVVNALAIASNGDVYAGGSFTQTGGVTTANVAKWNGTAWSPLGAGVNATVWALATAGNGDVYAGGQFTAAGGGAANAIAKWNGTTWSPLGTGLTSGGFTGFVGALTVASNGDVYAGGNFAQAGAGTANNVAKWNGTTWSSLGTGLSNTVSSVALGATGKLHAGGSFAATGDASKLMSRFAIYDPNAPLAAAAAQAAPAAQLFPNPAHGAATLRLPAGAPRLPLTLANALGQVLRRYPAPATAEAVLDLRGLPVGAYIVRCGEFSQRLVVE